MNKVFFGDCRDSMRKMAKDGIKVQTCITSPPYYGLRDYGVDGQIGNEQSTQEFIDNLVEVFACVWDLLEDDGTLWVNLGDSYYNYRPGKGQALSKQSVSNNLQDLPQTCARRGNKLAEYKEKDLMGMPWRLAFALQDFGWYLRQDIIWHKPNPMPESVRDRCTKAHEYIFLLSKSERYFYDHEASMEPVAASTVERLRQPTLHQQEGSTRVPGKTNGNMKAVGRTDMRNRRSVWTVATRPYKGAHFAVYPEELIKPCVMARSRVGDIVLDPFFGSGTTGALAQKLGRKWIGCELNKNYESLQNERLSQQGLELL